jgi:hypothetical protein
MEYQVLRSSMPSLPPEIAGGQARHSRGEWWRGLLGALPVPVCLVREEAWFICG